MKIWFPLFVICWKSVWYPYLFFRTDWMEDSMDQKILILCSEALLWTWTGFEDGTDGSSWRAASGWLSQWISVLLLPNLLKVCFIAVLEWSVESIACVGALVWLFSPSVSSLGSCSSCMLSSCRFPASLFVGNSSSLSSVSIRRTRYFPCACAPTPPSSTSSTAGKAFRKGPSNWTNNDDYK